MKSVLQTYASIVLPFSIKIFLSINLPASEKSTEKNFKSEMSNIGVKNSREGEVRGIQRHHPISILIFLQYNFNYWWCITINSKLLTGKNAQIVMGWIYLSLRIWVCFTTSSMSSWNSKNPLSDKCYGLFIAKL